MQVYKLKKCKRVHGLHFAPDGGPMLAVGGAEALMVDAAVWLDLDTGAQPRRLDFLAKGYAVTPDLTRLALGGADQYAGSTGREPVEWTDPQPGRDAPWHGVPFGPGDRSSVELFSVAFDPDGGRLAVGYGRQSRRAGTNTWTHHLSLCPLDPPGEPTVFDVGDLAGAIAFAPDGSRLALTGGPESMPPISLIDPSDGRTVARYDPPGTRTRCLTFSPDGTRLAAANARAVYILSAADLTVAAMLDGHKGQINAVAYSPDGRRLLAASHDGAIRVWDTEGGRLIQALDWKIGPVTALTVAPDGLTAAAAGKSGQVVIWDLDD